MLFVMLGQLSAESAVFRGGVRNVSSGRGVLFALGSPSCRVRASSYMLVDVSVILEYSSKEVKLLCPGFLVTERFCSMYEGGED
jgi:hypothetical protein